MYTTFLLPPTPLASAQARRRLLEVLPEVDENVSDTAELLVSELVTNAVVHAPPASIAVRVDTSDERLRIEVNDVGTSFQDASLDNEDLLRPGQRGLFLVDAASDAWGIDNATGTTVWFELAFAGPSVRD